MINLKLTTTRHRQVLDITGEIEAKLPPGTGLVVLNLLHTTAALSTADLDPGTDLDLLDAFEAIVPKLHYRHPHDPSHVGDHILSTLIGTTLTLLFRDQKFCLGTWQRVVLIEFDGPRERNFILSFIMEEK